MKTVWNLLTIRGLDNMTRCTLLDKWFDAESKRLDKEEEKQKKDLITGDKKWNGRIFWRMTKEKI